MSTKFCSECNHDWPERLDVFRRWIKATSSCELCVAELARRRMADETRPEAWLAKKERDFAEYAERRAAGLGPTVAEAMRDLWP